MRNVSVGLVSYATASPSAATARRGECRMPPPRRDVGYLLRVGLLLSVTLLTFWVGGPFWASPASADDAVVLPRGNFRLAAENFFYLPITQRFTSHGNLEDLAADIRNLIALAIAAQPEGDPIHAIAVAGTPTSLAAIDQELEPYDPGRVHGYHLGLQRVQRMLSRLSSLPLAERLRVPGLHPGRAPTIVAGTVILVQVMRAFRLQEIEVSELDILHGSALSAAMAPT